MLRELPPAHAELTSSSCEGAANPTINLASAPGTLAPGAASGRAGRLLLELLPAPRRRNGSNASVKSMGQSEVAQFHSSTAPLRRPGSTTRPSRAGLGVMSEALL